MNARGWSDDGEASSVVRQIHALRLSFIFATHGLRHAVVRLHWGYCHFDPQDQYTLPAGSTVLLSVQCCRGRVRGQGGVPSVVLVVLGLQVPHHDPSASGDGRAIVRSIQQQESGVRTPFRTGACGGSDPNAAGGHCKGGYVTVPLKAHGTHVTVTGTCVFGGGGGARARGVVCLEFGRGFD